MKVSQKTKCLKSHNLTSTKSNEPMLTRQPTSISHQSTPDLNNSDNSNKNFKNSLKKKKWKCISSSRKIFKFIKVKCKLKRNKKLQKNRKSSSFRRKSYSSNAKNWSSSPKSSKTFKSKKLMRSSSSKWETSWRRLRRIIRILRKSWGWSFRWMSWNWRACISRSWNKTLGMRSIKYSKKNRMKLRNSKQKSQNLRRNLRPRTNSSTTNSTPSSKSWKPLPNWNSKRIRWLIDWLSRAK